MAVTDQRKLVAIRLYAWTEWSRQVVRGVQRVAHDRNWKLFVDVGPVPNMLARVMGLKPHGLITHVMREHELIRRLIRNGRTKAVSFSAAVHSSLTSMPRVQVNDNKVAELIGRHLLAGGFRRLAYHGSRLDSSMEDYRREGLLTFAQAEGIPCEAFASASNKLINDQSIVRWVQRLTKPVGIVAWNIEQAYKVIQACHRLKIAVPEQVAVVSWDDDPMLAEAIEPTVSAAVLPAERLGFEAAMLLDRIMSGGAPPGRPTMVDPSGVLHVRQSSDVSSLKDREVQLALLYIREHAGDPFSISELASVLRISRKKLETDIARVLGKTPHDVIIETRLERAKQLLAETDWPMSRVAERSGMGGETTLRRAFIANEGMTPGEYRSRFGVG